MEISVMALSEVFLIYRRTPEILFEPLKAVWRLL